MSETSGDECPKCHRMTLQCGYGLAGGGMGVYFYCEDDACGHFDKHPDPELSTEEEMSADKARRVPPQSTEKA